MCKLCKDEVEKISDREAYNRRLQDLAVMSLAEKDYEVVVMGKGGKPLTYKLSQVPIHIKRFLDGKKDPIGELEIRLTKELMAYEKRHGRKA